jgi:diguanylate cyclase (GGDEF)-like protein
VPPIRGPLSRLERSRDELAKQWLVRLIERASLDEIRELPTEKIARELPELITGIVGAISEGEGDPFNLSKEQTERAASLANLRGGGREARAVDVARDVAALQTVLLRALRTDLEDDPVRFAEAVEQLVEATAGIQAAAMEAHVHSRSRELESQANTDPLTGLGNLRALQRAMANLIDTQKRYQHPFGVLLMDIDGLKRINDSHGHQAGDRVLMQVGMSLRRSIRSVDTAARIGGDEFCVLLPQQDLKSAAKLAARLATAIEEEVAAPGEPRISVSIGVAASPEHGDEAESLIDTADRAMYRAKAAGEGIALGDPPGTQGVTAEEATT